MMRNKIIYIVVLQVLFIVISIENFTISQIKDTSIETMQASWELNVDEIKQPRYVRFDYTDENGNLRYAADQHYASKIDYLDESGKVIRRVFLDERNQLSNLPAGYSQIEYIYDSNKQIIIYENNAKEPVDTKLGYSKIVRILDDNVITENFYNSNGEATYCTEGYHKQIKIQFSENECVIRYYDLEGSIVNNTSGYAMVKRSLNDQGRIIKEMYYDANDNPIRLYRGQYGVKYDYDGDGHQIRITYLDEAGEPVECSQGFAVRELEYYKNGSIYMEKYFDLHGKPVMLSDNSYGKLYEGQSVYGLNSNYKKALTINNIIAEFPIVIVLGGVIFCVLVMIIPKGLSIIFLLGYTAFIIFETLAYRESGGGGINLVPLWSYKQILSNYSLRLEVLKNIWLFVPFGAGAYSLIRKNWILIIPFIISIIIEVSQYIFGVGFCEIDDVISNTLGGVIGVMMGSSVFDIMMRWKNLRVAVWK